MMMVFMRAKLSMGRSMEQANTILRMAISTKGRCTRA